MDGEERTISGQELTEESLLAVKIEDSELSELLDRLAASDAMMGEPASTIRDVAELTEASPKLIARILGDIRGTSEFEQLQTQVGAHEVRIKAVEKKLQVPKTATNQEQATRLLIQQISQEEKGQRMISNLVGLVIAIVILGLFFMGVQSAKGGGDVTLNITTKYGDFVTHGDGPVLKRVNGEEVPANEEEVKEFQREKAQMEINLQYASNR